MESCCSGSSAHGTACREAQRVGLLACLASSYFKSNLGMGRSMPGFSGSPSPKMRTSADSSQAERASLESSCSASSAHGTARTEVQRLGLLACLATSNFKLSFWSQCLAAPAGPLRNFEHLQIGLIQKGTARKAVAQPHLAMALLTQRHRDSGCLLVLPPQTSNASL